MSAAKSSARSHGFLRFFFGFVTAVVVVFLCGYAYLRFGHPPVAAGDSPFPFEKTIVKGPLQARIDRQIATPPFGASEDAFESGARLYMQSCAACHGTPGRDVAFAKWMYPSAPQLWKKHAKNNVVGVSDDEPGETFWKIKNGIRLTGMPAYKNLLSDNQMWDIALLLKNADQPLPDPVMHTLTAK